MTKQNVQGCLCAPEGAVLAVSMQLRTASKGMGSGENTRTLRRVFISSKNARLWATISSSLSLGNW